MILLFGPPSLRLHASRLHEDAPVRLLYCGCTVSSAKTSAADLLLGACRPTERHYSPCISHEQTTVSQKYASQVARGHGSSSIRAAVRPSLLLVTHFHHPATFPSTHLPFFLLAILPAKFSHAWLTQMHTSQYYPLRQRMLSCCRLVIHHRSYPLTLLLLIPCPTRTNSPISILDTSLRAERCRGCSVLQRMHVVSREQPVRVGRHLLLFSHYLISLACRLPIGIVSTNNPLVVDECTQQCYSNFLSYAQHRTVEYNTGTTFPSPIRQRIVCISQRPRPEVQHRIIAHIFLPLSSSSAPLACSQTSATPAANRESLFHALAVLLSFRQKYPASKRQHLFFNSGSSRVS